MRKMREWDYEESNRDKANIAMSGIPLFFGILLLTLVVEFGVWFFVALFVGSLIYSFMLTKSPEIEVKPKKAKRRVRAENKGGEIAKLGMEIIPAEFHSEEVNRRFKKGKDISFIEFDNI